MVMESQAKQDNPLPWLIVGAVAVIVILIFGGNLLNDLSGNTLRLQQERTAIAQAQAYTAAAQAEARAAQWQATMQAAVVVVPVLSFCALLGFGGVFLLGLLLTHWQQSVDARREYELRLLEAQRQACQPKVGPLSASAQPTLCLLARHDVMISDDERWQA